MNDLAREALIEAELKNVKQAFGEFSVVRYVNCEKRIELCAMGVLHEKYKSLTKMEPCTGYDVRKFFEISKNEHLEILRANDEYKWSFLEIARKVGVKNEEADNSNHIIFQEQ